MQTIQKLIIEGLNTVEDDHAFIQQKNKLITALEIKNDLQAIVRELNNQGINNKTAVAVYTDDRIEMIKGMLGVIMARCVFVPIEGDYPIEMVREMLEIAQVEYILTDNSCLEKAHAIPNMKCKVQNMQELFSNRTKPDTEEYIFSTKYEQDDPIYVYFTSGTTGKPKAILGKNESLVNFVEWEGNKLNLSNPNVSQITSPCHDPFLRDVFLALFSHGRICIPENKNVILDGAMLANWIKESEISVLHCTPSVINHLLNGIDRKKEFPALHYVLMAGEKINPQLVRKWYELVVSDARLISLYGPTETTLAKLFYEILPDDYNLPIIPLGKPIPGTDIYIYDSEKKPCKIGETGEIYIATSYGTLGYLNNDQLNAVSFSKDERDENKMVYRTGDLGRVNRDGNVEFLGRMDSQVKIRGNRVELSYVESKILEKPDVKECVLVFNDDTLGKEYIAAYIVAEKGCGKSDIIDWLKTKVPSYMFPAHIVFLDELPLNKNMKVDKTRLPDPIIDQEVEQSILSQTEAKLVEECKDILEVENVIISDSFFALGGSSLNVMTLISRIYDDFEVEMSLEDIFDSYSLADLAEKIDQKLNVERVNPDTEKMTFSCSEYLERKKNAYSYILKDQTKRVIEGIIPFNDIFYRSCIYNSIFSVVNHFGADILSILTNDIILFKSAEQLTLYEKMDYIEAKPMEEVLKEIGVEMNRYEVHENIIQRIIDAIDQNIPVIIGVDCFYESIRPEFYLKENWPHNILVYGYDNSTQEMIVLEHSGINNLDYHEQRISYLDIEYAYQSNRIKYPKAENGKYYLEFKMIPNISTDHDKNYYMLYKDRVNSHMSDIRNNLEELPSLIQYIADNVSTHERIRVNATLIARLLDSIVEMKKSQSYLLKHLGLPEEKMILANGFIEKISKKWKLIRNVLYKYIYTEEYDSEQIMESIKPLHEVKELEKEFYEQIFCN